MSTLDAGKVQIYYGNGQGKSSAALGNALRYACTDKKAIIITFLKGPDQGDFMSRLEPEIRFFRFERSNANFDSLTDEEKAEEKQNIRNGLNFAKKVLSTEECDLLILDEVLGAVSEDMITADEIKNVLSVRSIFTNVILTGRALPEELRDSADEIVNILAEKVS